MLILLITQILSCGMRIHLPLWQSHYRHQRNISQIILLQSRFGIGSLLQALLEIFLDHALVLCTWVIVTKVAFLIICGNWPILRESSLSLYNVFIVPTYLLLLFALFLLNLLFLSLLLSLSLLDLFVEDSFHFSSLLLQLRLLSVVKLFWECPANMTLLFKLFGLFSIIHVDS